MNEKEIKKYINGVNNCSLLEIKGFLLFLRGHNKNSSNQAVIQCWYSFSYSLFRSFIVLSIGTLPGQLIFTIPGQFKLCALCFKCSDPIKEPLIETYRFMVVNGFSVISADSLAVLSGFYSC
jgi:hypothetical protein